MTLENTSLTTVTYFRFEGWNHQLWAMSQMQLALAALKRVPGLSFFKLLGTGRRFHYLPNFSVYGILGVWETIEDAQAFRNTPIFQHFTAHSEESWTVYLKNYQAHGYWSGKQPFVSTTAAPPLQGVPIAVITRATINLARLRSFWKQALRINQAFTQHPGCLLALGIGEWPVVQQATFSVWKDAQSMKDFAYGSDLHRQAIRGTRQQHWFKEDMFARFVPIATEGTWQGADPLQAYLPLIQDMPRE